MSDQHVSRRSVLAGAAAGIVASAGATQGHSNGHEGPTEGDSDGEDPDVKDEEQDQERHVPGLRVINLAPDVPAVDVYIDGEPLFERVEQVEVNVDELPLPDDEEIDAETTVTIAAVPHGESLENPIAVRELHVGDWSDMADYGWTAWLLGERCAVSDRELRFVIVEDDHSPTPPGQARIRAGHASPDLPCIDIRTREGNVLLEDGLFSDSAQTHVPEGETLIVTLRSRDGEQIAQWDANPQAGSVYSAWVVGYQDLTNAPSGVGDEWDLGLAVAEDSVPGTTEDSEENHNHAQ